MYSFEKRSDGKVYKIIAVEQKEMFYPQRMDGTLPDVLILRSNKEEAISESFYLGEEGIDFVIRSVYVDVHVPKEVKGSLDSISFN